MTASMFHLCFIRYNCSRAFLSDVFPKMPLHLHIRYLCSTIKPKTLSWEGSSHDNLLKNLETFLKNHQVDEAWEAYTDFKKLHGLPDTRLLSKFITELSYSHEPKWLQRACDITLSLSKEKSNLLHVDQVSNLSLSLARAQMPIPASMVLRTLIEKNNNPSNNILGSITLHMVKKEIGTYLASNILIQICDHFRHSGRIKPTKPDTIIFNLVLDACSCYNLSFKAQKVIELMAQMGVIGDAYTIIAISRIYAINGQRDELKKFKSCVDELAVYLGHHYFQFYDSLMSLHFKFNDIDSASELLLEMITRKKTLPNSVDMKQKQTKPSIIPLGSQNLKMGLKLHILPHLVDQNLMKLERNEGLVMYKNGKFVFSNNALGKLVVLYKRQGRVGELSNLLWRIQTEKVLVEMKDLISDVIEACIHVGWLETAHDILDDIEKKGNVLSSSSYASLLRAYREGNKHREVEGLLKQMKKAGIILSDKMCILKDSNDVESMAICDKGYNYNPQINQNVLKAMSRFTLSEPGHDTSLMDSHLLTVSKSKRSDLAKCLVEEMREREKDYLIYEFNSSIYFFTKAKMVEDALKTYKSMQEKKVYPTIATYIYMVMGYSSLEMYREITILWGDIKRSCDNGNVMMINRDLYEVLILNFLKGGYFERVMEVIGCMKKHGMYPDKWLYKSEFLKLYKGLYRKLKSSDARSEAQCKRFVHVKAFRKWAGID